MNLAFLASFELIQKNISYLNDNCLKQGYKVLFFPLPRSNYVCCVYVLYGFSYFDVFVMVPYLEEKT